MRTRELQKVCLQHLNIYPFGKPSADVLEAVKVSQKELIKYVSSNPDRIYQLHSRAFEEIITEVFKGMGFTVELTKQTRDGGLDVIAVRKDFMGLPTKYIIECKRYAPDRPIRVGVVRAFYSVKIAKKAAHALLATTSYFTKDAENFAKEATILNLHLKGLSAILGWLEAYQKFANKGGVLLGKS